MTDRAAARGSWRAGPARTLVCGLLLLISVSCASKVLVIENSDEILANKEYENVIDVQALPDETAKFVAVPAPSVQSQLPGGANAPSAAVKPVAVKGKKRGESGKANAAIGGEVKPSVPQSPGPKAPGVNPSVAAPAAKTPLAAGEGNVNPAGLVPRQPTIEDSAGFVGRRPVNDPWRVGESVTLELSYFNVVAGDMTLTVKPFKFVNGRKAYHFAGHTVSTSVFSMFYSVDDRMETFVDYEDLIPFNYSLHVQESKQLREVRSYFDWKAMKGFVWDKKVTKDKGPQEKKYEWDILGYTQNVFSAPFYLRAFKLEPGKKIQFRVGHEGKNLLLTAEVLRRETIETVLGEMKTVVIKPTIEIDGVFKPVGDILFWLTDDDRRYIVRLESKIKIGKVLGQLKKIEPGQP